MREDEGAETRHEEGRSRRGDPAATAPATARRSKPDAAAKASTIGIPLKPAGVADSQGDVGRDEPGERRKADRSQDDGPLS